MNVKKPPAFQFYARDWLASGHVRRMSYKERGMYFELLLFCWCDGGIPDDDGEIARLLNVSLREWRKCAERIRPRFVERGGLLVNERLESVRQEQDAHRQERSESGKAGAKKRWASHRSQDGSAINQPLADDSSRTRTRTATDLKAGGVRTPKSEPTRPALPPPLTAARLCPPKMRHAWCDGRVHVPLSLHHEFQRTAPDSFDLVAWYGDVDVEWGDRPIGDDGFTFWRARWQEHHGTTKQTDAQIKRQAQRKRDRESEQPR